MDSDTIRPEGEFPAAIFHVLPFVGVQELVHIQLVCKGLSAAVIGNPLLWSSFDSLAALEAFPNRSGPSLVKALRSFAERSQGRLHTVALRQLPEDFMMGESLHILDGCKNLERLHLKLRPSVLTVSHVMELVSYGAQPPNPNGASHGRAEQVEAAAEPGCFRLRSLWLEDFDGRFSIEEFRILQEHMRVSGSHGPTTDPEAPRLGPSGAPAPTDPVHASGAVFSKGSLPVNSPTNWFPPSPLGPYCTALPGARSLNLDVCPSCSAVSEVLLTPVRLEWLRAILSGSGRSDVEENGPGIEQLESIVSGEILGCCRCLCFCCVCHECVSAPATVLLPGVSDFRLDQREQGGQLQELARRVQSLALLEDDANRQQLEEAQQRQQQRQRRQQQRQQQGEEEVQPKGEEGVQHQQKEEERGDRERLSVDVEQGRVERVPEAEAQHSPRRLLCNCWTCRRNLCVEGLAECVSCGYFCCQEHVHKYATDISSRRYFMCNLCGEFEPISGM